jgi:hypothetical protein
MPGTHPEARAAALLPLLGSNLGVDARKRAVRELGDCLSDIPGDVSAFAEAILEKSLSDCESDASFRKFALDVLVDALEPSDYLPILIQRLKSSDRASIAALNCIGSLCDEVEDDWPLIDKALAEILAEKQAEMANLQKKQEEAPSEEIVTQIKAQASGIASLKQRISNWKDEQDWADDDEDY